MSTGQHIDYDTLVRDAVQTAKRSVVRSVLTQVARTGLVGGHHFLIAFGTQATGVILSKRLREKYPVEMTIVLQHRFWDLEVADDRFEVKLTFDSIPERLGIPFAAIKAFYDPSVPYMMPFDEGELVGDAARSGLERTTALNAGGEDAEAALQTMGQRGNRTETTERPTDRPIDRIDKRRDRTGRRPRPGEKADADGRPDQPRAVPPASERPVLVSDAPSAAPVSAHPVQRAKPALAEVKAASDDEAKPDAGGAKVLDLSSFRGKKK